MRDTFMTLTGAMALVLIFLMLVALVLGLPVMWLWNSTMPELFSVTTITFWQAVRLNILCGLLFKGTSASSNSSK